jgi:hypothetical protein
LMHSSISMAPWNKLKKNNIVPHLTERSTEKALS